MSDEADELRPNAVRQHILGGQPLRELAGSHARAGNIADQDVRLHLGGVNLNAWNLRQSFGEKLRVGMVLLELLRPLLQGHEPGRREKSCLPHASAQRLANDASAIDQLTRAD